MDKRENADIEGWVDDRLGLMGQSAEWEPDAGQGIARFNKSREAARRKGRRRKWALGVAAGAAALVFAFPVNRVLAARCVGACVAGTAEISELLRASLSSPGDIGTPLNQMTGKLAPDFAAVDGSGARFHLSDFRGKVVLLNFWATWCAPCTHEIPWFVEFQQKYGDAGLVVIGVSLDADGWKSVRPFLAGNGVNYRTTIGDSHIEGLYGGLDSLPTTVMIDRSGIIAGTHVGLIGHDAYENSISTLLNYSPPANSRNLE